MPALVINTNIASLNGQRNLYKSTGALNKSMERLSSGLRINRAGDDAAGLAISEGLRSQIRGLNQSVRNANDGISLITTAEGALDTYVEIIQRIRQLAINASSDVMSDDNRRYIQLEVDEQIDELDRIAKTMDFNGNNLFDGTFMNKNIQVGAQAQETLDISVPDMRTHVIGGVAQNTSNMFEVDNEPMHAGNISINGVDLPASDDASARSKAAAINSAYYDTGVYARVEYAQAVNTAGTAIGAGTLDLDAGDTLTINGETIPQNGTIDVLANDASGTLRKAINDISHKTGVRAELGDNNELVLTAMDDSTFTYSQDSAAALAITNLPGAAGSSNEVRGRVRLYSDSPFTVDDGSNAPPTGTQVGTTTTETLLGLDPATTLPVTFGTDPASTVDQADVTSFAGAQETILQMDNAMRQVMDARSHLGAIMNRLENTINNLQITSENLSASDSRIRDADFAAETAEMTRAQILQQSGVAVLAQANQTPQTALNLLQ